MARVRAKSVGVEQEGARGSRFGNLLRQHRIAAGLSQEALAERARMSVRGIGALERGDRRTPQRETLSLLLNALALTAEQRRAFEDAAMAARGRRLPGATPSSAEGSPKPTNLRLSVTSFVGRETEVTEIATLVGAQRLVMVTGPGGVGKTRTALHVATALNERFREGVWLADLAPILEGDRIVPAIASALGLPETPNAAVADALIAYLERKNVLIVLDNCEHLIERSREVVKAVLEACPGVHILATSRESLGLSGEHVYRLQPLPFPKSDGMRADELAAFEAPRLFAERARAADHRFELTDENGVAVAEICRRLDGMPLAIELAAARVAMFSPRDLARRLDDRFALLARGDPSAPPRQRTIRSLLDWSYGLLSDEEQALFRILSVFYGSFSLARVAAVCAQLGRDEAATLDLLAALVEKSLVQIEPVGETIRYRLLESMQQYARERLSEASEEKPTFAAHANVFVELAEELEEIYGTTADDDWKAEVEPDMENWRGALQWSLNDRNDLDIGRRLPPALRWTWSRFSPAEGRDWTQRALAEIDPATPPRVAGRLYLTEAQNASWLCRFQASRDAAGRAAALFLAAGDDTVDAAEAQWRIGNALIVLGRSEEGERHLRASVSACRRLESPKMLCWALLSFALARAYLDDFVEARALCDEALAIARERRFRNAASVILGSLADIEFRAGNQEAAVSLATEALSLAQDLESAHERTFHLSNLAAYLLALQRYDESRSAAREVVALGRELRSEVLTANGLEHLAATAALRPGSDAERSLDDRRMAARLLGYVNERLAALGALREATEIKEYDVVLPALEKSFGAKALESLMLEGRTWTEERAVAEALRI